MLEPEGLKGILTDYDTDRYDIPAISKHSFLGSSLRGNFRVAHANSKFGNPVLAAL